MAQAQPQVSDFAPGKPENSGLLSESVSQGKVHELQDPASDPHRRSATPMQDSASPDTHGDSSNLSQSQTLTPSRGGTLKKRQSLRKKSSVKRSMSGRLSRTNSMKSLGGSEKDVYSGENADEINNAFFTPVPTSGSPTEILASRFQSWRKVLKDLITYFRDVQKSYETRAKSIHTLSNVMGNIESPPSFLVTGGLADATKILHEYHKQTITEGNKAKSIEEEVISQLTNLRSDLGQKIKEIKSLSGDFKNNVDKETEGTRKAVQELSDALHTSETDPSSAAGKSDPFIVKLAVDRQVERQIEEENYLHRAFLNLESSGRELESIVVGEVQKAYNAFANIITREADEAYEAVEKLKAGPIAMPKDHEWKSFVHGNEHFVDPRLPVRRVESIYYPGKENPAASEIRSGMLERKSKYLKSYTPGWYVLSPTHIHEFKSPDRITSQTPVMSLTLMDQKLGSHSSVDSTSHKFMLKGRQSGGMHRGHAWVFRAESYDTMMAWFNDIKALTENTGEAKAVFIRKHARSVSAGSHKAPGSISSDGMDEEDEADKVPYSATPSVTAGALDDPTASKTPERPNPGGRFPSALNINRDSSLAPSSPSSSNQASDRDVIAAALALPAMSGKPFEDHEKQVEAAYQVSRDPPEGPPESALTSPIDKENEKMVVMPSVEDMQSGPVETGPEGYVPVSQMTHFNGLPVEQGSNPLTSPPPLETFDRNSPQTQNLGSEGPAKVPSASPSPPLAGRANKFLPKNLERHDSTSYGAWMGTTAAEGLSGPAVAAMGVAAFQRDKSDHPPAPPSAQPDASLQNGNPLPPPPPGAVYTSSPSNNATGSLAQTTTRVQQTPIAAAVLPVTGPPEDPFRESRSRAESVSGTGAGASMLPGTAVPKGDAPAAAYDDGVGYDSRGPSADGFTRRPSTINEVMTPTPTADREKEDPLNQVMEGHPEKRPGYDRMESEVTVSGLHVPGEFP